jgi:hypothetical protein
MANPQELIVELRRLGVLPTEVKVPKPDRGGLALRPQGNGPRYPALGWGFTCDLSLCES